MVRNPAAAVPDIDLLLCQNPMCQIIVHRPISSAVILLLQMGELRRERCKKPIMQQFKQELATTIIVVPVVKRVPMLSPGALVAPHQEVAATIEVVYYPLAIRPHAIKLLAVA